MYENALDEHKQIVDTLVGAVTARRDPLMKTETGLITTTFSPGKPPADVKARLVKMQYETKDGRVFTKPDQSGHVIVFQPTRQGNLCDLQVRSRSNSAR